MQARDDNQQGEYLSFHSWCLLRSRCLLFNHPTEFLFSKNTTFLHIAKSDSTRNQSVFLRSSEFPTSLMAAPAPRSIKNSGNYVFGLALGHDRFNNTRPPWFAGRGRAALLVEGARWVFADDPASNVSDTSIASLGRCKNLAGHSALNGDRRFGGTRIRMPSCDWLRPGLSRG
jgi:hypothetical protein